MKLPTLLIILGITAPQCQHVSAASRYMEPTTGILFPFLVPSKAVLLLTNFKILVDLGMKKRLTEDTMSPALKGMEYAVRGQVVIAADKINEELKAGTKEYPFDHIVYTNIGNPHSVGQKPLTWPRQVMALVDLPDKVGVDHPDVGKLFPADALRRAREIKIGLGGHGSGAYSHSKGVKLFREDVARFIQKRDGGVPSDAEDIFLTNGASDAIKNVLTALVADQSW